MSGGDAVKDLLIAMQLPVADLSPDAEVRFFAFRDGSVLTGVIGLEVRGSVGMLRSLAVAETARGRGAGRALVAEVEARARDAGVEALYLLTATAGDYFARLGYRDIPRSAAPEVVSASAQYTVLCPASARLMTRHLRARDGS